MTDNAGLIERQQARRNVLVERIGYFTDGLDSDPLPGEKGDVAYELLIQAAAQISSDALTAAALATKDAEIAAAYEACARVAENIGQCANITGRDEGAEALGEDIADAIRALGAKP